MNGDGFDDVLIGARFADLGGPDAGSSYVVFGKASGFPASIDLSTLNGQNGFRVDGKAGFSGDSVSAAGDINGDGFADVIIGAPYAAECYVVFGKGSAFPAAVDVSKLNGHNGFTLRGSGDHSGWSVGAEDVNGDGLADPIIGAIRATPHGSSSGSVYVVFGKASAFPAVVDLTRLDGQNGFRLDGLAAGDETGNSVGGARDINGDGFGDFIIGAVHARSDSGSSYVVFGKHAGFPAHFDLSTLDGSNGFRLDGVASGDQSAYSVSGAGDVNGDGFDDVIVGAAAADPHGSGSGSSYVVFGKGSGFTAAIGLSTLDGTNGFRLDGIAANDDVRTVASAGDVNADGFADVIIGSSFAGPNDSGSAYVVFGKSNGFPAGFDLSGLNGRNGFRLDGVNFGDEAGISVDSAPDLNGDGLADLVIGAFGADPHGSASGSSYVVFGRAPDSARTRSGSETGQYISGGVFDDTLKGFAGRDILEGRGGADRLIGGLNKDAASYLHSLTGITADLANPGSNTGNAAGDSYTSIKNLVGSRFADTLTGNGFSNSLTGDEGPDILAGHGGPDLFVYNHLRDSLPGAGRDQITDFDAGTATTSVDEIDVRAIDAKTGPGNQAFTWIGTAPFSNTKGELRVEAAGTSAIIQGDVDGDGTADLEVGLLNFTDLSTLTAIDFRL